jgi:YidC/Oxa1 family membrane protein insertase
MFIWDLFVGFLEQVLLWLSMVTGSAGVGIIIFTVFTRVLLLPLTLKSIKSNREMQKLQPKIKELQRKYGKDQRKLQEETVKLYQEHKINPLGGCLPMLMQLPIFIGVYWAVLHLMDPSPQYQPVSPEVIRQLQDPAVQDIFARPFLGFIHLGTKPFEEGFSNFNGFQYIILPVLALVLQFSQQLMAMPRVQDPQQKAMSRAMMFMPLFFGYITLIFPAGAVLYWTTSSVVGIIQQYYTTRSWGSLANFLKFLPADAPSSTSSAESTTRESDEAASGAATGEKSEKKSSSSAPIAQRPGFWDVLKPLTELPAEGDGATTTAPDTSYESSEPEKYRSGKKQQPVNPRRSRRRRS